MLAHFHYANKGSHPFAMDWTNPGKMSFAKLDAEQIDFIRETIREVELRSKTPGCPI